MTLAKRSTSALAPALVALTAGAGSASADAFSPQLTRFKAEDRIAAGKVARYDLREESTAFSYRIRAQRIEARVQRLDDGEWTTVGTAKASAPRPLDFWPVFKKMGVGTYRIVARAANGSGDERQESASKTIRFTFVGHIAHRD